MGRGKHYSGRRALIERLLSSAYVADWPARAWPDGAHFLTGHVALLLAGHTHGGQIALPGPRPIVLPPGPYSRRYPFGLHDLGGTQLLVSRGVGTTELPIRLFAPADILLVELTTTES